MRNLVALHAKLTDVDLRGADLHGVEGVEGLRGATVSSPQLFEIAPGLAHHLGIAVDR